MATAAGFEISGTGDIECSDWDRFCVGVVYTGGPRGRVFYDGDEMIDHLREIGGTIWFHAGGVYDLLYILERARARGIPCQVDRSQHRVTRIVMGRLTLRDSYGIWPVPLDDICGALGRPVPELPWACTCGRDCGGFCRIGEKASEGDPELEDYCQADAIALYDGLHLLRDFASANRIELKGTLGHTAWINAQKEIGIPDSDITWDIWRHARRGDRGGRGQIFRPRAKGPGAHHDICNAYPAQLAKAHLPVGDVRELDGRRGMLALGRARPGMYTLTVDVPESFLPPLPYRIGGMMTFPHGRLSGTWTLPEIGCAIDRGVEIVACHAALVYEGTAPIFEHVIARWYDVRREIGRKTPLGQWIGRMAKAVTGKLAEKPDRSRITMHPAEVKICTREGPCRLGCVGKCGAYEQVDLFGHIWAIPYRRLGPSCYPQWSAYLRAMTRVQWLEQAERFVDDLVFGNTDSLWHTSRLSPEPLGDGLGEWEYQHAWWDLEVRALTAYAFRRTPKGPLEIHGVPGLTEEDWKRGSGTIDRGVVTFGAAAKGTRGLFSKRQRRWTLPGHDDEADRVWYGDRKLGDGGVTYAVAVPELRAMLEQRRRRHRIEETKKALTPSAKPRRTKRATAPAPIVRSGEQLGLDLERATERAPAADVG